METIPVKRTRGSGLGRFLVALVGIAVVGLLAGCDSFPMGRPRAIPGIAGRLKGWNFAQAPSEAELSKALTDHLGIQVGYTEARTEFLFDGSSYRIPAQGSYLEAFINRVGVEVLPRSGAGGLSSPRTVYDVAVTAFVAPKVRDPDRFNQKVDFGLRFQLLGRGGVVLHEDTDTMSIVKSDGGNTMTASHRFVNLSLEEVRSAVVAQVFWVYTN